MKIIFVAPPGTWAEQLKKALIQNGQDIYHVSDREIEILPVLRNNRILWKIIRKVTPLKRINNIIFNLKLVGICRDKRPDILFVNKGMIVSIDTLEKVKKMGIKTANWFLENTYGQNYFSWFLENYHHYDYYFCNDTRLFNEFSGKTSTKFYNIPVAVDPDYYKVGPLTPEEIEKYSCDVCFVGAFDKKRERILKKINDMGGINIKIFGWEGWKKSSLAHLYHGPLTVNEMAKLFSCAKICMNANVEPVINGLNMKNLEIPVSGGFQISDHPKDIDDFFKVGEEIIVYNNEDEIPGLVRFYLDNKDARNKIIEAGRKRILAEHTLSNRIREILTIIV